MCKYPDDKPNERCKEGGKVEIISRKIPSQVNNKKYISKRKWFCIDSHISIIYENDQFQADKDAIVQKHNELRARVANGEETLGQPAGTGQPKASNMRQLVWNDELAEVAQRYYTLLLKTMKCNWILIFRACSKCL